MVNSPVHIALDTTPLPALAGGGDRQRDVTHLLALPDFVDPGDLEFLIQSRVPRAAWETLPAEAGTADAVRLLPGRLRMSPRTVVHGPYAPLAVAEDGRAYPHPAGFASTTQVVYALTTRRERGEPPLEGVGDRDGIARMFAEALPIREEGRQVLLLVALARLLEGTVHCEAVTPPPRRVPSRDDDPQRYRSVTPDAKANVNLTVYSDVWLDPAAALRLAHITVPAMGYMPTEADWDGPAPVPDFLRQDTPLSDDLISLIHKNADDTDREVLAVPAERSAYGLVYEGPGGNLVTIDINGVDVVPPVLDGLDWVANGVIEYRFAWTPDDLVDWQRETPSFDLRKHRTRMAGVILGLAHDFYAATGGEVVDQDGFLKDPSQLRSSRG